jgi:hypothetical protein
MQKLIIFIILTIIDLMAPIEWESYVENYNVYEISLKINRMNIRSTYGLQKYANNMTSLNLGDNDLVESGDISFLVELKHLDLSTNRIQSLKGLENLTLLSYLYLSSNKIRSLDGLQMLTRLEYLYLSSNNIQSLNGIENLIHLTFLKLDSNQLRSLKQLQNLTRIIQLHTFSNQIQSLEGLENINLTNRSTNEHESNQIFKRAKQFNKSQHSATVL